VLFRSFKYPELREEAVRRRGELVTAALTILRAHALAGRPAAGVRRVGSFEKWAATVASAIAWAGGADVTGAMPRADTSDDPVLSALRVLLEAWPLFAPTGHGLRLGALADKLYPPQARPQGDEEASDDELGHVREALELLAPQRGGGRVRFDARKLGYVLRAHRGRNLGGRAFEEGPTNHGAKTWVVVDPKTGLGICFGGGSGGSGGSFTSDAGAPRAHTRESAHESAHAGRPQNGLKKSPTSPTSPTVGFEEPISSEAKNTHTPQPERAAPSGLPSGAPPTKSSWETTRQDPADPADVAQLNTPELIARLQTAAPGSQEAQLAAAEALYRLTHEGPKCPIPTSLDHRELSQALAQHQPPDGTPSEPPTPTTPPASGVKAPAANDPAPVPPADLAAGDEEGWEPLE
jgi:hypothetical protein